MDKCSCETITIDGEPLGSDNKAITVFIYKVKGKEDVNRKALLYFRGGGAILLTAKHYES